MAFTDVSSRFDLVLVDSELEQVLIDTENNFVCSRCFFLYFWTFDWLFIVYLVQVTRKICYCLLFGAKCVIVLIVEIQFHNFFHFDFINSNFLLDFGYNFDLSRFERTIALLIT